MSAKLLRSVIAAVLVSGAPGLAHAASEQQNLEELRNTVVNLLQALVDQGVMTREKAAQLVKQAQDKAASDVAAAAKKDEGAVRVPYVPQVVKDDIARQVAEEVKPAVVEGVVQQAKQEGWGVPGAMPEWLGRTSVTGDVRLRYQGDFYGKNNANAILDFNAINNAGGVGKAGINAFLNTTEDNERLRLRGRFGATTAWGTDWRAGVRLATGSAADPSSESQTLGTGAARYQMGLDLAYITYAPHTETGFNYLTASFGRIANPWFSPTELIYARDLTFEGIAATGRVPFAGGQGNDRSAGFLTLGAFPIQNAPLAQQHSKWLLAAQLGTDLHFTEADRLKLAAGYYDFVHVAGIAYGVPVSATSQDPYAYSAPQFIRYGNSQYGIAFSSTDGSPILYGLASQFRLVDVAANFEHSFGRYALAFNAHGVRNVGYDTNDILRRTGQTFTSGRNGYVVDLGFGDPAADHFGRWRATVGYRYVQADAVLDAWTDADFHEGGTNARGYYLVGDFGVADRTFVRLRYMASGNIETPFSVIVLPGAQATTNYNVDILQVDLNTRF